MHRVPIIMLSASASADCKEVIVGRFEESCMMALTGSATPVLCRRFSVAIFTRNIACIGTEKENVHIMFENNLTHPDVSWKHDTNKTPTSRSGFLTLSLSPK